MRYRFEISADRRTYFALQVLVPDEAVQPWESVHGRSLTITERYAVAKLVLLRRLDDAIDPAAVAAMDRTLADPTEVLEICELLEI